MLKTLAVAALLGPLGLGSLTEKSSTSFEPEMVPAVVEIAPGGADPRAAGLTEVHHRYWHNGGYGNGGNKSHHNNYYYVNNAAPSYGGLSSIIGPCDTGGIVGGLVGAVAGGLAGSQIGKGNGQLVAVGAGVLLGALLGHEIGAGLTQGDLACADQAVYGAQTVPVGQQISWNNPQSGNSGYVVPVRDGYEQTSGRYCREYQTVVTVGGRQQSGYGTACYQPDGSWQVID
jgi:surface antigen